MVLQYKQAVLWLEGLQEENCVAIQNCIATERLGSWAAHRARRWALGWACNRRWGDKRAGASGRAGMSGRAGAGGRAGGRRAGARRAQTGRRQCARDAGRGARGTWRVARGVGSRGARRGRAAWASGACCLGMPVRAGWACWLVSWAKLVHCAPGSVLTQFLDQVRLSTIPESLNEHCSLQIFFFFPNLFFVKSK